MEIKELIKEFISVFGGTEEDIRVFASPGRVNMIGEHTDYSGGYVFPAALKMQTTIVMRKRNDNLLRLKATDLEEIVEADINKLNEILLENDICFNFFTDTKHNNLHYIRTAKLDTIKKFFDFIYEDSAEKNRLKRKYDKFISLLEGRCA